MPEIVFLQRADSLYEDQMSEDSPTFTPMHMDKIAPNISHRQSLFDEIMNDSPPRSLLHAGTEYGDALGSGSFEEDRRLRATSAAT